MNHFNDHAVEAQLLSCVLLDNATIDLAGDQVALDDFAAPAHRIIWEHMCRMRAKGDGVDLLTLRTVLVDAGQLKAIGGDERLTDLLTTVPTVALAEQHARRVADLARRRRTIEAVSQSRVELLDSKVATEEAVERAVERVLAASHSREAGRGPIPISKVVRDIFAEMQKPLAERQGVPTGLHALDQVIQGGMRPGELHVLAGRPGMGKSSIALGIALRAAQARPAQQVLIFSIEMPADDCGKRMLAHEARVPITELRQGELTSMSQRRLGQVAGRVEGLPIHVDETAAISLGAMRAGARRVRAQTGRGLSLIVVDYLQIMTMGERHKNVVHQVGEVSAGLRALAKEMGCPVLALSQLNRECEKRTDKRPQLSDLRDSGAIEQDADVVLFAYRDEVYNPETTDLGIVEIRVAKQRHGTTRTVRAQWQGEFCRVDDIEVGDGEWQPTDYQDHQG
jgi:replicative DNA helicase